MSQQNVELVRNCYAAWNAGDLDAATRWLHPSIEWRMPPNFPESGTFHGIEEVAARLQEFLDSWERFVVEVEDLLDGGEKVVALTRFKGRSKLSGLALTGVSVDAQVWTLSEGRVTRVWMYGGTEEALREAGLRGVDDLA